MPSAVLKTVPTSTRPSLVHHRSEEIDLLIRLEATRSCVDRIIGKFLGSERFEIHGSTVGPVRAGLAWMALPDLLELEGWCVAGSFGVSSRDEPETPEFDLVPLSDDLTLEIPANLVLLLERGSERCGFKFERARRSDGTIICSVGLIHRRPMPDLPDRWLHFTREHNVLRGRCVTPSGEIAVPDDAAELREVLVSPEVRSRLDLALRRFSGAMQPRLRRLGVRAHSGLILSGPPGTGKTSLGRELMSRAGCSFLWVTPGDLRSAQAVEETFALARWLAPTIIFLEDLDLVAESRDRVHQSSLLGELMNELDGLGEDVPVLTIATTNRLAVVEEALRNRPGRFDQVIEIGPPDDELRAALLSNRLRGCRIDPRDLAWLSAQLKGATGAEVEEMVNRSITLALLDAVDAEERPEVQRSHLTQALGIGRSSVERRAVGFTGE